MNKRSGRMLPAFVLIAVCLLLALAESQAESDLSQKEARKIIANMAGIKLPSDAVRVRIKVRLSSHSHTASAG